MLFLYCLDPLDRHRPDDMYAAEAAVADRLGLPWTLIDHDAVVEGDAGRAVRRVPPPDSPTTGIYRGWMMTAEQYRLFHQALEARGVRLINTPDAYRRCHHLPESYAAIEGHTPRSVWLPGTGEIDLDRVMELLRPFGDAPLVLKDYVKSQKHAWDEACFIPSASDREAVARVTRRFVELQGPDLACGLVYREFVAFDPVGRRPRSGLPLTLEYRLFFLDGRPLLCAEYWEGGDYQGQGPPVERFAALAAEVRSRFFTMDVARRRGGDWLVVELGDGQVAGMPEKADVEAFYRGLAAPLGGSAGRQGSQDGKGTCGDTRRHELTLIVLPGTFAACRLPADAASPAWAAGDLVSVTRTADELSIVCREDGVPEGVRCEPGWRRLRVAGTLDFSLVGVLASLLVPLAEAGVGVFCLSTFDTDYLLVRESDLARAAEALRAAGHRVAGTSA